MQLPNDLGSSSSRKSLLKNNATGGGGAGEFSGATQTSNERKQRARESDQVRQFVSSFLKIHPFLLGFPYPFVHFIHFLWTDILNT